MTIKSVLKDNVYPIISDLNEEMLKDRIVRFWDKVDSNLTLNELVDKHWVGKKAKKEFSVDLGVSFGKNFELYLPFKLKSLGCNVEPTFTSDGDMVEKWKEVIEQMRKNWELKTGQGKFIQGATHSPKEKKPLNLIQVLWNAHWDKTLVEIKNDRKFIKEMNICVFDNIVVDSVGEHSDNNSRTSLIFRNHLYNDCLDACVFGDIKNNPKNVGFVKESVDVN